MIKRFNSALVDAFFAHHWKYHPVDATLMGEAAHDHLLPPAGYETLIDELADIDALHDKVAATEEPEDAGQRLDRKMMLAELTAKRAEAEKRPRLLNPAWYTGEAAMGIISLLLPQSTPIRHDALIGRLNAVAGFLADGSARIDEHGVPASWTARARKEAEAMAEFLKTGIRLHEAFDDSWAEPADAAAEAFEEFASVIEDTPDGDAAAGEEHLGLLIRDVHGLDIAPRDAVVVAEAGYARLTAELEEMAKVINPDLSAVDQIAKLADDHADDPESVMDMYLFFDIEAVAEGSIFATPAQEYDLEYRWMLPAFRKVSKSLPFINYRTPPALNPGEGSVYWVMPPEDDDEAFLRANNKATVRVDHAARNGGIGRHTQNTRARDAQSQIAQVAGTDAALGLAFSGAGSLVEGWARYAQGLLMEARGFYRPEEILVLKYQERLSAAAVIVDIKLHLGEWSMLEAIAFYQKAGLTFAEAEAEVVSNSMLPGSRLVVWLGVEGIKALRKRWTGDVIEFHDTLLSFGDVPVAWIGQEMESAGQLAD